MSHDFQMARSHDEKSLNLAVGEPFFLQDALREWQTVQFDQPLTYPLTNGQPRLLEQIQRLHPGMHVIVTHGAKYAIQAALYALKQKFGYSSAFHKAPYWPSYPTMARLSGLTFNAEVDVGHSAIISTSPNNPDGSESDEECDLWDAAYHGEILYKCSKIPKCKIAVYSCSKLFGFSGLRIGWAVTTDDDLAREMSTFMEITTSGVSVVSQSHVAHFLDTMTQPAGLNFIVKSLQLARNTLENNGRLFRAYVSPLCSDVEGLPMSGKGMFAWFKAGEPDVFKKALETATVKLVTGEACGVSEPGWYRMSMGHRNDFTEEALFRLNRAYGT